MNEQTRECLRCDRKKNLVFVPDKQNAFWGRLVTCPLCEGSGRVDLIRWAAYQLLAVNGEPTYEEIVAMVNALKSGGVKMKESSNKKQTEMSQ